LWKIKERRRKKKIKGTFDVYFLHLHSFFPFKFQFTSFRFFYAVSPEITYNFHYISKRPLICFADYFGAYLIPSSHHFSFYRMSLYLSAFKNISPL